MHDSAACGVLDDTQLAGQKQQQLQQQHALQSNPILCTELEATFIWYGHSTPALVPTPDLPAVP